MTAQQQTDPIPQFFLRLPLRKTFLAITGITILLLIGVACLGARQYLLYRHCEQVVATSRHLLFQFNTIKEHINEALITRENLHFKDIIGEIELLEGSTGKIMDDILVPEDFKQNFISQVDLVGLVVQLRSVQDAADIPSSKQLTAVIATLRSIDGRITQLHQGLSAYTQALLLGLHKTLAGFLALVLAVVSSLLLLVNRTFSGPILQLGRQLQNTGDKKPKGQNPALDVSVHEIMRTVTSLTSEHQRLTQLFNAITLYDTFIQKTHPDMKCPSTGYWQDLCSVLQTNGDYCLVWVGALAENDDQPRPICASGYLSTTEEGYLDILDHLLKYCKKDGGLCDSINITMQTKTAIVSRLFTASLPESLRELLPVSGETFSSASFPVSVDDKLIAVITLYNSGHHCFQTTEISLLSYFFHHLDLKGPCPATADPFSAEHLPMDALSRIYRFSTLGSLTTGLAHELTNLSNGVINYTQALLDLTEEQGQTAEARILLDNLLNAEKKISRMAVELQQLSRDTSEETRPYTVQEIINTIDTLTSGQIKTEGIELKIDIARGLPAISKKGKDILLVLLSLLQCARIRILAKYPAGRHERKQIQINASLTGQAESNTILITISDQGTPWKHVESPGDTLEYFQEPWLEITQCKLFLQNCGGELMVEPGTDAKNICSLLIPC